MEVPDFLLFASDATLLGLWGLALWLLAAIAWFGERRRMRRKAIDAVGYVPWTSVFLVTFFCGTVLIAIAAMGWLRS